jgi:cell division protein FtsA
LVLSILATSEAVLTSRQKELGVAVVNIGGSTTSLAVFEEGDILHTKVLPVGSDHITSDIAIGLRISIDTAEKIKLEYGTASSSGVGKRDEIDIGEIEGRESNFVSRKYVSEITEARVEEIFEKIDAELKKIDKSGKLPAGVVLTGGGSKLQGLVEAAKKQLRLPATLGKPLSVTSAIDKVNDLSFSTAIGLVIWGSQLAGRGNKGGFGKIMNYLPDFKDITGSTKKLFNKLIKR